MDAAKTRPTREMLNSVEHIDLRAGQIGKTLGRSFSIREMPLPFGVARGMYFYKLGINIQTMWDMTNGETEYTVKTGGFFTTKLSFLKRYDSSTGGSRRRIKKYKPGNWESSLKAAAKMIENIYERRLLH